MSAGESAIPKEWIEAGARALGTDAGCTADFDTLQRLYGWEAEAVLAATLPLIRESIAREMDIVRNGWKAQAGPALTGSQVAYDAGYMDGLAHGAALARGGAL